MKLQAGQVVVITGAGGGLGRALAQACAERGCALALSDIKADALDATKASLSERVATVSTHIVNVADSEAMAVFADDVLSEHGAVNLLINNAGLTLQKSFETHSLDDWELIMGVNLWGVIHGAHFFAAALKGSAPDAHMVNLSSMSSFIGLPGQSSYCATKAGVELLSASIWAEWAEAGVGVTHIHPGAIRTDMILNTLENSDDIKAAKRNYHMAMKMGIDAEKAASKILRAVEWNKKKLRIGRESHLIDYMTRFAPPLADMAMKAVARKINEEISP